MKRLSIVLLAALAAAVGAAAQGVDYIRANYTKYEYEIPMRDGKKLFTSVYVPKAAGQTYPILLMRTPYSVAPYGEDVYRQSLGPSDKLAREGFIFVYQDVRGCHMSEGEFVNMRPHLDVKRSPQDIDESSDTYDTIDWLVKHIPNNNGKVGLYGISYPGFYTAAGIIGAHPALKAASPQAPITDWFVGDDFHHNGVFWLPHAFNFFNFFGKPRPSPRVPKFEPGSGVEFGTPDGYEFFLKAGTLANLNERYLKHALPFWNEIMRHGTYDEFWQSRNLRPHLKQIKPAVLTVGGWFDAENLFGAQQVFKSIEKAGPVNWNGIAMGPWFHGGWSRSDGDKLGNVSFNAKTSEFYRDNIEFPFFMYWLKDKGDPNLPKAYMFETGSNLWRRYDQWPPKTAQERELYFGERGALGWIAPTSGEGFDEYVSDPAHPVPYIANISTRMTPAYMTDDQRFAATRPDVLVYQTEPLTEDTTLAGPLTASLNVSTTGTDSDWVVKLVDVYPGELPGESGGIPLGGYQQLVRGEVMRGKFRNSYSNPEPFVPGKLARVEWALPDVNHNFRRGHRIMIQVQSTWFPLADRNPQKFQDIYDAKMDDFQKATQRVYRNQSAASGIRVYVLAGEP
jgi:uncharacterized protein